jgi:hypothetical protein
MKTPELTEKDVLGKTLVIVGGGGQHPLSAVWLNEMGEGDLAKAKEHAAQNYKEPALYVYPKDFDGALPLSRARYRRSRFVAARDLQPGHYICHIQRTVTGTQPFAGVVIIDLDDRTATPPIPGNVAVEILDTRPVLEKYAPGYES